MKHLIFISIDTVGKNHQKYFTPEAIQISGIKVTKDFIEVGRFLEAIKPLNAPVDEYALKLAGLKPTDINSARPFNTVCADFEAWVGDISESSFVFWGKEDVNILIQEIKDKKYSGKLNFEKYFNFQSYLWSKTGKQLSLKSASELFASEFKVISCKSLWTSTNLKNLYTKVIPSIDVNQLWYEGKMKYVIEQLMEISNFFAQSLDFSMDIGKLIKLSNQCYLALETATRFSASEKEEKLNSLRAHLDEIQNDVENIIIKSFRDETISLQWAVLKGRLPQKFATPEELMELWKKVSEKYLFFKKNRRGSFGIRFEKFRNFYKQLNNRINSFYQRQKMLPIDTSWFET